MVHKFGAAVNRTTKSFNIRVNPIFSNCNSRYKYLKRKQPFLPWWSLILYPRSLILLFQEIKLSYLKIAMFEVPAPL